MPSQKPFDKKFGTAFLKNLPTTPGVYFFKNQENTLIYIGKAKNLRRRLSQYKNTKRCKKHKKMRSIIKDAFFVSFQTCSTEQEALLLEAKLIQEHRPKWNISGAFYFLYPLIGVHSKEDQVSFCLTTKPELFSEYKFFGAFRSRFITGEAFFSLMRLFKYLSHPIKGQKKTKGSYVFTFRKFPLLLEPYLYAFLQGTSRDALESLILHLVENAGARSRQTEVQQQLNHLLRFWRHEALPLARALKSQGLTEQPVDQKQRDFIFLNYRYEKKSAFLSLQKTKVF